MRKIINSFKDKKFRYGAFSSIITFVIITVLIGINFFFQAINVKIDLSNENLFTLSGETLDILKELDNDVSIYALFQTGKTFDILDEYARKSKHITVEYKDPDLHPDFAFRYANENGVQAPVDSIIVESRGRFKVIPSEKLTTETSFNVEHYVTNGILYTQSDLVNEIAYYVTGHNESPLGEEHIDGINNMQITLAGINLSTNDIPEDTSTLILSTPLFDYSKSECDKIENYLSNGGNALFLFDKSINNFKYLKGLVNSYGVNIGEGVIIEGNKTLAVDESNIAFYSIPDSKEIFELGLQGPLVFEASPVEILDERRQSIMMHDLLITSDKSYLKSDSSSNSFSREAGDIDGPFSLAVFLKEENINGTESNIIFMSTSILLNEDFGFFSDSLNTFYFLQFVSFLSGDRILVDIPKKSLIEKNLLFLTNNEKRKIVKTAYIYIPAMIMGIGTLVWLRRRHR